MASPVGELASGLSMLLTDVSMLFLCWVRYVVGVFCCGRGGAVYNSHGIVRLMWSAVDSYRRAQKNRRRGMAALPLRVRCDGCVACTVVDMASPWCVDDHPQHPPLRKKSFSVSLWVVVACEFVAQLVRRFSCFFNGSKM